MVSWVMSSFTVGEGICTHLETSAVAILNPYEIFSVLFSSNCRYIALHWYLTSVEAHLVFNTFGTWSHKAADF